MASSADITIPFTTPKNANMAEGTGSWKPQGDGPHPTLGGNLFDPNVGADGMKNSSGGGVGGTSEQNVMEEGAEHINQRNASSGLSSGTGATSDDYGASSSTATSGGGGVTGWVKGALGFGTAGPAAGEPSATEQHNDGIDYLKSRSGAGAGGVAGGDEADQFNRGIGGNDQQSSDYNYTSNASADEFNRGLVREQADTAGSNSAANTTMPRDSDVTTGAPPTESADPTTADTSTGAGDASEQNETTGSAAPKGTSAGGGKLDNPDAIPTAGGERLGKKHWGESKVVPDAPPRRASEADNAAAKKSGKGVSSADGQPNAHTASNTQANTGSAQPLGQQDEHKEGLVDKMKHMVHK